jgi:hypothetical protein
MPRIAALWPRPAPQNHRSYRRYIPHSWRRDGLMLALPLSTLWRWRSDEGADAGLEAGRVQRAPMLPATSR